MLGARSVEYYLASLWGIGDTNLSLVPLVLSIFNGEHGLGELVRRATLPIHLLKLVQVAEWYQWSSGRPVPVVGRGGVGGRGATRPRLSEESFPK